MDWSADADAVGLTAEMRSAVLENLSEGVYIVDRDRRIRYWNRGASEITGFAAAEVVGRQCGESILNHCNAAGRILCGSGCPLRATIDDGQSRETHLFLRHKDGHRQPVCVRAAPLRGPDGEILGAVETFHDDSSFVDARRQAREMRHAAMRDALTGVGNRRLGDLLLDTWLAAHQRLERTFGVLFIDLDDFKAVNDRFGHDVGDRALRAVAATLRAASRRDDEVVRWGGDEFVVLVADADRPTLSSVSHRLRMLVRRTAVSDGEGRRVRLGASVGAALVAPGDTAVTLVRRADLDLYRCKAARRDRRRVPRAPL
jgi:diguanylate cyclase (GGDEF)-like protein/PAS domain S-box-containing protein